MPISSISFDNDIFKISYKINHLDKKHDILFLHGWGSNKEIMQNAFINQEALKDFRLIFVDMPGFGQSSNDMVLNTSSYVQILNTFCEKIGINKNIIIGHSFGGKVATLLNPDILVLLSSAGIVVKKPFKVLCKIYLFKVFKFMGAGFLYKFFASKDANEMSRNMYETFKNVVDEDFSDIFKGFDNKALIFWGIDDKQTPLSSGEKISQLIKKSFLYPMDGEHFFFASLDNAKQISTIIKKEVNI